MRRVVALGWCLLALAGGTGAQAAERSCAAELGPQRAAVLVKQCITVSPATRPPCNAANSCRMIEDEILRGCALVGSEAAPFCDVPAKAGVVTGTLVGGGGVDDLQLIVRRDDGSRVSLYCKVDGCEKWFDTDQDEVQSLKKALAGRRVGITVRVVRNNGGVAGPGDDELLPMAVRITFLK